MKFMVTFDWAPDSKTLSEGIARFRGVNLAISKSTMPDLLGVRMPRPLIGIYEIQREDS